jgi:hypothetical protein
VWDGVPGFPVKDYDLFHYGKQTPQELMAQVLTLLPANSIVETLIGGVIDIHILSLPKVHIQVICRTYASLEAILLSFDLDSCRGALIDNGGKLEFYWTNYCAFARHYGVNIIHYDRPMYAANYAHRVAHYIQKGFQPLLVGGFEGLEAYIGAAIISKPEPMTFASLVRHAFGHSHYQTSYEMQNLEPKDKVYIHVRDFAVPQMMASLERHGVFARWQSPKEPIDVHATFFS